MTVLERGLLKLVETAGVDLMQLQDIEGHQLSETGQQASCSRSAKLSNAEAPRRWRYQAPKADSAARVEAQGVV